MPNISRNIAEPSLKDLLDLHKRDIFLSFNCHAIGTVEFFNPLTQTISASISYKKTFMKFETPLGTPSTTPTYYPVDYPILVDVPIIIIGGGNASLTMPISIGDSCLILFNDRDIDVWFQGSTNSAPATNRLHSFSDGVALIGLNNLANISLDYDSTRALLKNELSGVGVSSTSVKIYNSLYTLGGLLQNLITEVKALVTQTAALTVTCSSAGNPSSVPINIAAIQAVSVQLTATALELNTLLE